MLTPDQQALLDFEIASVNGRVNRGIQGLQDEITEGCSTEQHRRNCELILVLDHSRNEKIAFWKTVADLESPE
jgi:hypothetical protein